MAMTATPSTQDDDIVNLSRRIPNARTHWTRRPGADATPQTATISRPAARLLANPFFPGLARSAAITVPARPRTATGAAHAGCVLIVPSRPAPPPPHLVPDLIRPTWIAPPSGLRAAGAALAACISHSMRWVLRQRRPPDAILGAGSP